MWQVMIVVATTLASIVTAMWFLTIILVRTTKATAEVLTAALSPPITEESQPAAQPDLTDPDWMPQLDDLGLPIPPTR